MQRYGLTIEGKKTFDELGKTLKALFDAAKAARLLGADRTGFYYAALSPSCDEPIVQQDKIAVVDDPDKIERYMSFSVEKCVRLSGYPSHLTSFQSRDKSKDRWPGGIRIDSHYCAAISGLPWEWDEALIIAAHLKMGMLGLGQAQEMVAISSNPVWPDALRLLETLGWSQSVSA